MRGMSTCRSGSAASPSGHVRKYARVWIGCKSSPGFVLGRPNSTHYSTFRAKRGTLLRPRHARFSLAQTQPYLRTRPLTVPRRARAAIRPIEPDAMHRSRLVQQVINKVMTGGKKSIAEQTVYDSLAVVGERTGRPPVEVLDEAIKELTPVLEVRSRRVGGATYQVHVEVQARRARTLAGLRQGALDRRAQRLGDALLARCPGSLRH